MRSLAFVLPFVALTFCSWGIYGPVLHHGQEVMGDFDNSGQLSTLRPFICVGIAYFLIAVVVPVVVLRTQGEKGRWTMGGLVWSFAAGSAGALGALGIILAFKFRGSPVYVMPLVFGCAPVVNTFVTMLMTRSLRHASPVFFFGVLVVAIGASGVMLFKPQPVTADGESVTEKYKSFEVEESESGQISIQTTDLDGVETTTTFPDRVKLKENKDAFAVYLEDQRRKRQPTLGHIVMIVFSIALTALCWGAYGPVLHKGQMKMNGSRLRPFMCVGLAYFAIAVIVPFILMPAFPTEAGGWRVGGIIWSLLGGAAGAVGALGIIYAFNFGGKPIFVMPLVFGGAPVINTFTTILTQESTSQVTIPFYLSLFLVIAGAMTVLVFAPKAGPKPARPEAPPPDDTKVKRKPLTGASWQDEVSAEPDASSDAPNQPSVDEPNEELDSSEVKSD